MENPWVGGFPLFPHSTEIADTHPEVLWIEQRDEVCKTDLSVYQFRTTAIALPRLCTLSIF